MKVAIATENGAPSTAANVWAGSAVSAASATIKFTDSTSNTKTLEGGNHGFGTLWASGSGTGTFVIQNVSGTFTFKE